MLPFSVSDLNAAVAEGRVTKRDHPSLPYSIYNYSPDVQYSNKWDEVTLNCRGLILDSDYNIVARPWKKFFNLGQVDLPIQFTDPVEVMDKADGSLGILYPIVIDTPEVFDIVYGIATRGSFESTQAQHASRIWQEKYHNLDPMPGYTMLFEIVYPENRIVLDYGDMDDLILLGAVENETGYYLSPKVAKNMFFARGHGWPKDGTVWPGPVVEVFEYNSISEALGHMDRSNAEGYVIRSHNFMVKLKQPDYLELHRLVTNASPKTVWEQLKAGKSKSEIVSAFPDEFHDYIGGMIDPLIEQYNTRLDQIISDYNSLMDALLARYDYELPSRREIANAFSERADRKFYFLLLDGKPVSGVLWDSLKPKETALQAAGR